MRRGSNEVLEVIRDTLAVLTDVDTALVVSDARWEDFGADQYDFFGVLREIQKRYEIEIPSDDAFEMEKVDDLITFVVANGRFAGA